MAVQWGGWHQCFTPNVMPWPPRGFDVKWPCTGSITGNFNDPTYGGTSYKCNLVNSKWGHTGVDIGADSPVTPGLPGWWGAGGKLSDTVNVKGTGYHSLMGYWAIIEHTSKWLGYAIYTYYCHLADSVDYLRNKKITLTTAFANTGRSGSAVVGAGNLLHFEVRARLCDYVQYRTTTMGSAKCNNLWTLHEYRVGYDATRYPMLNAYSAEEDCKLYVNPRSAPQNFHNNAGQYIPIWKSELA